MSNLATVARLNSVIATLAPIISISVPTFGTSVGVIILFDPSATQTQIDNANAALASFDWSDAATITYLQQQEDTKDPNRATLLQAANNAINNNQTFLAIPSPTNAQAIAQLQAITQQVNKIIQRLIEI